MNLQNFKTNSKLSSESGQLVIEYVLLLLIVITLALIMVAQLGDRNSDKPGAFVGKWRSIMNAIGSDNPDRN